MSATTTVLDAAAVHRLVLSSVSQAAASLVARLGDETEPDPGPRATPRGLRQWLARLRLLEAVPFSYLVPHVALLPAESVRFFVVDRAWTDALVEGALSVGTVTTADKAALESLYPTVRGEVDEEERLVRLPGWERGQPVPSGAAGTLSGFLLRSKLVSGWPALHVRGYGKDPRSRGASDVDDADDVADARLATLRMERLAPAVLLVVFDGVPRVVHVEEPRVGVQFGVDLDLATGRSEVAPRSGGTGERLPAPPVRVRFRRGGPGVIHVDRLCRDLLALPGALLGTEVDAAEFALQMLQFPYRLVFGETDVVDEDAVFAPRIGTEVLRQAYRTVLQP